MAEETAEGGARATLVTYMHTIAESRLTDWIGIYRPTFLHRFTPFGDREDPATPIILDEHLARFTYRPDISIGLAYGLIEDGDFRVPGKGFLSTVNARTELLDCFHHGQLLHREPLLRADRRRLLLPMPVDWHETPMRVPRTLYTLVRLVHALAGPLTDFDANLERAGMTVVDVRWP